MNTGLYAAFVAAAVLLILIPGPIVLMLTSKSLRHGLRAGLAAVGGSFAATLVQLGVVVAGLTSIVALVGEWFDWLRWIGAAYLIYLGIRSFAGTPAAAESVTSGGGARPQYVHFLEGFLVTLTNPKTLLFLGAFLPQFVDPALPAFPQLLTLAVTFLVVALLLDSTWASVGARAGRALASAESRRCVDRISGTLLIGAGALLAVMRRA